MPAFKNGKILGMFAYQVDEKKLNTITRDYLNLGDTGEIALVVQVSSQAYFITPTRNDPTIRFTKLQLFGNLDIQRAARGEKGSRISIDHRSVETLSAYAFIPRVDWGPVLKIDVAEVLEPLQPIKRYLIFFAGLSILLCALVILMYSRVLTLRLRKHGFRILSHIPHQIQNFPLYPFIDFCLFISLFFALVLLHRSLHEAAPATYTLYIEYAFFYTYIIIIMLVMHTILLMRFIENEYYQQVVVASLKIFFWPLQLFAWIITTLVIFY